MARTGFAFLAAVFTTYLLATSFYTQQILVGYAAIGAEITAGQQFQTYWDNFSGLTLYGAILTIALLVGFIAAFAVKRVLKPLARIAYPAAGAAAVFTAITLLETQLGGGAGILGGARTSLGVALQCLAGAAGGLTFALLRPHGH